MTKKGARFYLNYRNCFKISGHTHIKVEQHFILKGQYEINGKAYGQGTYLLIHPGMAHL